MLGSLTDALIVIVVAILLLGGERDVSGHVKEIGKLIGNIRKSEKDFRNEITRELNLDELTGIGDEVTKGVAGDVEGMGRGGVPGISRARPYPRGSAAQPQQDARVRELEEEVRRLRMELEELRSRSMPGSGSAPDPARTSGSPAPGPRESPEHGSGEDGNGSS